MLIALTLHFIRHGIIFPFIPLLAEQMGAGPMTIGFIVGSFSLIAVFLSIPLGGLVGRFGVKRLLVLGVSCNIVIDCRHCLFAECCCQPGIYFTATRCVPARERIRLAGLQCFSR